MSFNVAKLKAFKFHLSFPYCFSKKIYFLWITKYKPEARHTAAHSYVSFRKFTSITDTEKHEVSLSGSRATGDGNLTR
jgi:hypothetical protein